MCVLRYAGEPQLLKIVYFASRPDGIMTAPPLIFCTFSSIKCNHSIQNAQKLLLFLDFFQDLNVVISYNLHTRLLYWGQHFMVNTYFYWTFYIENNRKQRGTFQCPLATVNPWHFVKTDAPILLPVPPSHPAVQDTPTKPGW